ncbi:hypothetical protein [Acaryochloris marina]|uniref:hypothetical protein n=1 Tax=Acaryochloris marina TaxID=155978 RepID=UPI001BB08A38|nr:hypothetical protein [Acaryochloris marina]QUY45477.1 hypothetical protein I1H34_27270 [Acaryochloris marina S15]
MLKRFTPTESPTTAANSLNQVNPAEQQSVDEISLLLEQLMRHESTTVKLILDRLYDIGSTNLINQKVTIRSLNRISRAVATQSKPIFRFVGFRWFQHHCPQLITDWLHEQVMFQSTTQAAGQSALEVTVVPSASLVPDQCSMEVQNLRSQLRWRTGLLCGALSITGSLLIASHTVLSRNSPSSLPTASPITAQNFSSVE